MNNELIIAIISGVGTIITVYFNNNKTLTILSERLKSIETQIQEYKCNFIKCNERINKLENDINTIKKELE